MLAKPLVGVSGCLMGLSVRYDGGHKNHKYITQQLSQHLSLKSFCPEVLSGMSTPRKPIRLIKDKSEIRCVTSHDESIDVTDSISQLPLKMSTVLKTLSGFVVKKDSPSCGLQKVKVYWDGVPKAEGTGIFTAALQSAFPSLPIEDEGRLCDPQLREQFIQRVFAYDRWKQLISEPFSIDDLRHFHFQHQLLLMSHSKSKTNDLKQWLSAMNSGMLANPDSDVAGYYGREFMAILTVHGNAGSRADVLNEVLVKLQATMSQQQYDNAMHTIEDYRLGMIPLIVPVTLLNHYYQDYVGVLDDVSCFLAPYPPQMQLMNRI